MHPLPRLELRDGPCRLPALGRSIAGLYVALTSPGASDAPPTLQNDPAFVLWSVLRADREGADLRSLADVHEWLVAGGLGRAMLDEEADANEPRPWEADEAASAWANLFAESVLVGSLASRLATDRGADASAAAWLGLLHKAPVWLALGGAADVGSPELPFFLARPLAALASASVAREPEASVLGCVRDAQLTLADQRPPPESFGWKREDVARRRDDLARQWRRESPHGSLAEPGDGASGEPTSSVLHVIRAFARLRRLEADLEGEKFAALAEFAAGAGHEINNPLANISGRAQLLLRGERDPERRQDLAQIHAQALRVQAMIADLMLIGRPPELRPRRVDLAALLSDATAATRESLADRPVKIETSGLAEPVWLTADPTHLQVAVRAILDNAAFAVAAGGTIEVALTLDEGRANIVVRDDGPGLTPHVRRHLFDPYFSGREAGRGLGMGLAKARAVVERHRGRIDVVSEPGRGATFTIRLPRDPE